MIFSYQNSTFVPPAPALDIHIRDPQTGRTEIVVAKLDTVADGSVIPAFLAVSMDLIDFDKIISIAFDGQAEELKSYIVDISIAEKMFTEVEVITAPIAYALIGRDILNQLVITFDGPQLTFDIQ